METTTESRRPRALEDPSGRRLRRMRWLGRAVAVIFLLWFAVILLGALGVAPVGRVPFGNTLRPSAGPPPLRRVPAPRQPTRSDLVPALPATVFASRVRSHATHRAINRVVVTGIVRGHSSSAPGHATVTTPTHGHSASAPGHTTTTTHGHSGSAPGRATTTTTTTTTPTHGHAPAKRP